ncbi:MAG TPA: type II secretion system F family protein [Capsulimonadaceae bacterium]|nr:type II secretion system F family protein [Capsulimonadaceae bacterium]
MAAYDLAAIYRQLAALSGAGVSPAQSFDVLARQSSGANKQRFQKLMERLWKGERVSQAMAAFPRLFPASHCLMVVEGETTGRLDSTLTRLAQMTEHSLELRRALQRELTSPTITMLVALPFVIFLLPFVAGPAMVAFAWILVGVFCFMLAVAHLTINLPGKGRAWAAKFAGAIPKLGTISRGMTLAYFARSFSMLYGAGVPLSPALRCAAEATGDGALVIAARSIVARVDRGEGLMDALEGARFFPSDVLAMARTGEATGGLDGAFEFVANIYEEEMKVLLHVFGMQMGVAAIVIVAILVGIIVVSFWRAYFAAL